MTLEEKGAYIELLMMQFNRGHMDEHMITHMVGHMWDRIKCKFKQDQDGLWYNQRLDEEKLKRKNYTESRRSNLSRDNKDKKMNKNNIKHMDSHMDSHMENVNRDINISNKEKGGAGGKGMSQPDKIELLYKAAMNKLTEKKSPLIQDPDMITAVREFIEYRVTAWAHKPFTVKAAELMATSLIRLSMNNLKAAMKIIHRSIEMSWQGLFALPQDEWDRIRREQRQDSGYVPAEKKSSKTAHMGPQNRGGSPATAAEILNALKQRKQKETE